MQLILSDAFIALYNELTNAMSADPNSSPDEDYDNFAKAIRKHRPHLLAVARSEIGIQSWLSRFTRFAKPKDSQNVSRPMD